MQNTGQKLSRDAVLETFARHESAQDEAAPAMIYSEVPATVHRRLAEAWNLTVDDAAHARFGAPVPD